MRHEIVYSAINLFIIGIIGATIITLSKAGYTKLYIPIDQYGWWYVPISLILAYLFRDFWFYWAHRFLHSDYLLQKVHYIHHLSVAPRPFTALSFHPIEGFLVYIDFLLMTFIIPMHWLVFSLFTLYLLFHDIWGHSGYTWFPKNCLGKYFIRVKDHDFHHQPKGFRNNYSAYSLLWDWLMGTLKRDSQRD